MCGMVVRKEFVLRVQPDKIKYIPYQNAVGAPCCFRRMMLCIWRYFYLPSMVCLKFNIQRNKAIRIRRLTKIKQHTVILVIYISELLLRIVFVFLNSVKKGLKELRRAILDAKIRMLRIQMLERKLDTLCFRLEMRRRNSFDLTLSHVTARRNTSSSLHA